MGARWFLPLSAWACVTLLPHENHTPKFFLRFSPWSLCFSSCRRIGGQACCKSQISRFRWDVHDQNAEQGDLRVRIRCRHREANAEGPRGGDKGPVMGGGASQRKVFVRREPSGQSERNKRACD